MKNKREIVESKYPPRNNEDIWLKDLLLYASTTKGWLPLGSEKTYSSKEELLADKPTGGTIGIDKETGEASIYNDVAEQWSPLSGGDVTSITWQELKDKRDAGKLIPGSLYRITDYNCTTTQENTQSAGHQFDIVLLALSEDKLAEEGWAMMHDNIYDVTFVDGVTKKCYLYKTADTNDGPLVNVVDTDTKLGINDLADDEIIINETNKTATITNVAGHASTDLTEENLPYNYFQNSNLSAWKVWYCLDNDTARFAWADDSFTCNVSTPIGDIDDYQLIRDTSRDSNGLYGYKLYQDQGGGASTTHVFLSHSKIVGSGTYTIDAWGHTNVSIDVEILDSISKGVIYRLIDEFNNDIKYDFKNIQFKRKLTNGQYDATNGTETWCYTLNLWYNGICQDASIVGNTLLNDEGFVKGVYDNNFGYATAYDVYIEGVSTFAFALGDNVVLSFDNDGYFGIYSNTIGNDFNSNTIGNCFYNNIIGNSVTSNTIGNESHANTIGNSFRGNTIGDWFCSNNIGHNCTGNVISDSFVGNKVGNGFSGNNINKNFSNNEIGASVIDIVIDKAFVQYIKIANGVEIIRITSNATTSQSNYLQNFAIGLGVKGVSSANRKIITHATVNDTKQTTYLPTNSTTINV